MLAQAFPQIRTQKQGEVRIEEMPLLRNVVVVDNEGEGKVERERLGIECGIEWREVLMWGARGYDGKRGEKDWDEVINLQFTRCAFFFVY